MADDVYTRLRAFLDTLPAGFPASDSGVELKILKRMFTPEQAELTMALSRKPETARDIARRTGRDEKSLSEALEQMAADGLIFRLREGETRRYHAYQFLVGIYEFQLNRLDEELCGWLDEYLTHIRKGLAKVKTRQLRVVPVQASLGSQPKVAPYNRIREMVDKEDLISLSECICKKKAGLLGHPCEKPTEVCIMFGDFARYYIDNQLGRQISRAEAHATLDLAEENGLVLTPSNTQRLEAICCCCPCCCPTLSGAKGFPNPGDFMGSIYRSRIDKQICVGCGECESICPTGAIKEQDDLYRIVEKKCIGCGLCVKRCAVEAISMYLLEDRKDVPPETFNDVLDRIAGERQTG